MKKTNVDLCQKSSIIFTVMMAIFYILSIVGQLILGAIVPSSSFAFSLIASTFSVIAMIASWIIFSKMEGVKMTTIAKAKKFDLFYLLPTLLIAVGMFLGLGFVNSIISDFIESIGGSIGGANIPLDNIWHFLLFSITLAVLPAIFEEIFFRGIMLYGFKKIKPSYAVIISAVCFALYHGSLTQLIYQFIYGVMLGALAIKTKSTIPGMIIHFLNNFAVLAFSYFDFYINLLSPILIVVGSVVLILGIVFLMLYKKQKKEKSQNAESLINFFFPYGLFIMLVCLIMAILSAVSL